MRATVTSDFSGVPDGEIHPRTFKPGDTVEGELAAVAVEQGWAEDEEGNSRRKPDDDQPAGSGRKGRRA